MSTEHDAAPRVMEPWRLPLVVSLWILMFVLSVTQYAASALLRGDTPDLLQLAAWSSGWLVWIVLTALVTRLVRRFPLERASLGARLPVHLAASVVAAILVVFVEAVIAIAARGEIPGPAAIVESMRRVILYRFHVYVLVYWAVVATVHALSLYDEARARERRALELERELALARLARLRGQLQPHFLFNTLNSVQSLLLTGEPKGATTMIARLSDLLRMSLDDDAPPMHTLRRELEMLGIYLEIQKVRFEDRLRVTMDVDDAALDAEVPELLLQPIVENCVEHALSVDSSAGAILVSASKKGDELEIVVADDGPGARAGAREGKGLGITRRRLESQFGGRASLALESVEPRGAKVKLTMPFRAGGGAP